MAQINIDICMSQVIIMYMLWCNFFFGLQIFKFNFCFPLSQIHYCKLRQRKTQIELNFLNQKKCEPQEICKKVKTTIATKS